MTDQVHPTQGEASSQITSGVIKNAGHVDWIVPSDEDYLAGFAGLSGTPLNDFAESHSGSSFDVTIDTGEAFVGGRWCARDVTTTVALASGTSNQTIYLGWESSTANSVVIGLDSAFSSTDNGRRTELYECDTDGSGVTNVDTLHINEPLVGKADDANTLDGIDSSAFAQLGQSEVVRGLWSFDDKVIFNDTPSSPAIDVQGSNETDSDLVTITGDGDTDQNDDLLKIYGVGDPDNDTPTDADTVFITKGEGLVGINRYNPTRALDVDGDAVIRGVTNFTDNVTINSSADISGGIVSSTHRIDDGGNGVAISVSSDGRFYMAPMVAGESSPRWEDEISYHSGPRSWKIEAPLELPTMSSRPSNPNVSTMIYRTDQD